MVPDPEMRWDAVLHLINYPRFQKEMETTTPMRILNFGRKRSERVGDTQLHPADTLSTHCW
jgi:hypothetical protein